MNETLVLTLEDAVGATTGPFDQHTRTILDEDVPFFDGFESGALQAHWSARSTDIGRSINLAGRSD